MRKCLAVALACVAGPGTLLGQITSFPYVESFDSVSVPGLPTGWTSTQNRTPGTNDFTTTTSTVLSPPNSILSTNSTIEQSITSPLFDFQNTIPDSLIFFTRRSASHTAGLLVEASLDGDTSFAVQLGDTLTNPGNTNFIRRSVALPQALAASDSVRFRWRSLANGTGSTGTLRIDDIRITVQTAQDLSLDRLTFIPLLPAFGDSVLVAATVTNRGTQIASSYTVEYYADADNDSIPDPAELITSIQSLSSLAAGDSVVLRSILGIFSPGSRLIIGKLVYPPDQQLFNNQLNATLLVGYPSLSIVVNEIMYAPTGTEPEWVELYSPSQDTIDLQGWLVSDNIISSKKIITQTHFYLLPNHFCILTRDSAALRDIHPEIVVPILQVSGFPTLNNSGDAIIVYDIRAVSNDSVSYLPSWGGSSGGYSLERIDPAGSSTQQSNWGTSTSILRSTPGVRNSITMKDRDLRLKRIDLTPAFPTSSDSLRLVIHVDNVGFLDAASFSVMLFEDANQDSIAQPFELLSTIIVTDTLRSRDSLSIFFDLTPRMTGVHQFIGRVKFAADEDTLNNAKVLRFAVLPTPGAIRINEIMYSPVGGIPEWVELINTSSDSVRLEGWKIGNRLNRYSLPTTLIAPFGFLVITKDSALMRQAYPNISGVLIQLTSLPTFLWNNNGDAVVLAHTSGLVQDTLTYFTSWGGSNGTSLERIDASGFSQDSTNWGSSLDSLGATPGRNNSIVLLDDDLAIRSTPLLSFQVNSVVEIPFTILNKGKNTSGPFSIEVYLDANEDSVGTTEELMATLPFVQPIPRRDSLVSSYQWSVPSPGDHGFIFRAQYSEDGRASNNTSWIRVRVGYPKGRLIINEIMYDPLAGQAEYVELYNPTGTRISLSGWSVSDLPGTSGSINSYKIKGTMPAIAGGSYFVIASDSTLLNLFPSVPDSSVYIVGGGSLSLNNDGDAVVIRDILGSAIDSVLYSPAWHNPGVTDVNGRSLERINPSLSANDARNWSTCATQIGGTPTMKNSIFSVIRPTNTLLEFQPNPFSPDGDGRDDFTIILYELPLQISVISAKIYDVRGRLIRRLATNEPAGAQGQLVWDGKDDDGRKARIGMYIVLLEAIDEQGGVLEQLKGVVVLAAQL